MLQLRTLPGAKGVRFSQCLYGRILSRVYRGVKRYYYLKGMLHNTLFAKIKKGQIFVEDIASINFNVLKPFGEIIVIEEGEIDETVYSLKNSKDYWFDKYKDRGVFIYVSQKNR